MKINSPETAASTTAADSPATPPAPTIESLQAENAALRAQLASLGSSNAAQSADERVIVEKMAKGLTRAQAIAAVRRQKEYDATPEAKARAARVKNHLSKA